MDPAMDADLVPFGDDAALLVGVNKRGDGGHIERRLHVIALKQLQDARHANPVAELPPGEPSDRLAAVAQVAGFMVAIERQRDGAARAAWPSRRTQGAAGPHPPNELSPMLLRPLPRFESGFG